jgi:hypothetical protein
MAFDKEGESESIDEFKFTFEYYLDHAARIEVDVSLQIQSAVVMDQSLTFCSLSR